MLRTVKHEQGVDRHTLNIEELLGVGDKLERFNKNWEEFQESDPLMPHVYTREGNELTYLCDHHVPELINDKKPLFLLFGNSTPHSIFERLYFAYEGNEREHRMWKLFKEFGIVEFDIDEDTELRERNRLRKKALFDLTYNSPFRVAMDVFISLPSTPSRPPWSGVAGIQKLLGRTATEKLKLLEQKRMDSRIKHFMKNGGTIIAFQKDAYNAIISANSPKYELQAAIDGELAGAYALNDAIKVYGVAPTRWLNGGPARSNLKRLIQKLH